MFFKSTFKQFFVNLEDLTHEFDLTSSKEAKIGYSEKSFFLNSSRLLYSSVQSSFSDNARIIAQFSLAFPIFSHAFREICGLPSVFTKIPDSVSYTHLTLPTKA